MHPKFCTPRRNQCIPEFGSHGCYGKNDQAWPIFMYHKIYFFIITFIGDGYEFFKGDALENLCVVFQNALFITVPVTLFLSRSFVVQFFPFR